MKNTLAKVCLRFEEIISDEGLWKYWVHQRIKGCFPPLRDLKGLEEEPLCWLDICMDLDLEKKKWTHSIETTRHIIVKEMHYASVDAVLLVNVSTCKQNSY